MKPREPNTAGRTLVSVTSASIGNNGPQARLPAAGAGLGLSRSDMFLWFLLRLKKKCDAMHELLPMCGQVDLAIHVEAQASYSNLRLVL